MKVCLYDLDINKRRRPFPNLALMKLSAHHKAKGDEVAPLNFPLIGADISYGSCVFTWNKKHADGLRAQFGGGGIDLSSKLPSEVEHTMPDYNLYADPKTSIGYTSRGCFRKCPWCKVPIKEGDIEVWASPKEFYDPRFDRMLLLDNNILASPNWKDTLVELSELPVVTDFNQGLDIRILNDEHIYYLRRIKTKKLRFAFDSLGYERAIRTGIKRLFKAGFTKSHLSFYVLIGFPSDNTAIERMKLLQSYGVDIYPMIYKDDSGKEPQLNIAFNETIDFRGGRGNMVKFLRVVGRI